MKLKELNRYLQTETYKGKTLLGNIVYAFLMVLPIIFLMNFSYYFYIKIFLYGYLFIFFLGIGVMLDKITLLKELIV